MLRNSTSRFLTSSRRSWQRVLETNYAFNNHSSKRANGSLSHLCLNSFHAFGSPDRREEQRYHGLPGIYLTEQQTSSLLSSSLVSYRSFSTTNESSDPQTFRERVAAHRERGQKSFSKGAHSLRDMIKKYGKVFVGTYFVVYMSTLGGLYLGIESGVLDPAYVMSWVSDEPDAKSTVHLVAEFLDHYSWTRPYVPTVENNPQIANLAVAWIAVKFTEPIRFGTTVAIVPRLSRYLGYSPPEETAEDGDEGKDNAETDDSKEGASESKGDTSESEAGKKS